MSKKKTTVPKLTLEQERALFLKPCKTRQELKAWIKYFLNLELPDVTVSRYSDTNPLNVVWEVYDICVNRNNPNNIKELLFVAGRGSGKTLGMAIAELMVLLHDKREVVHVGAIQNQAERCYAYQKNFLYNRKLKPLVMPADLPEDKRILEKANMSKSLFNVDGEKLTLEVIPCTLKACVDPLSMVRTKHGYTTIDSVEIGDFIASWDPNRGEKMSSIYRKIIDKWVKFSDTYRVTFDDGSVLVAGSDNKVLSDRGWIELQDLNINSRIIKAPQFKKLYSESNFKWQTPKLSETQWKSALIGMMLGDAGISQNKNKEGKRIGNVRLYKAHCKEQFEYLYYCKSIIESKIEVKQVRDKVSGFGSTMKELITESTPDLNFLKEAFYNNSSIKSIGPLVSELLDEVGLAFWIQDDGINGQQLELSTCGFTDTDCKVLIDILIKKFGLLSAHIRESHEYNVIRFSSNDTRKIREITKAYIHPTMFYKISDHVVSEKVFALDSGDKVITSGPGRGKLLGEVTDGVFSKGSLKTWFINNSKNSIKPIKKEFLGKRRLIDIEVEGTNRSEHSFLVNGIISAQCNGPHVPLVVVDEIDTVSGEGVKAFKEITGMLDSRNGKEALRVGISTRKTRYGLMNRQIENAELEGRTVRRWTAFEFVERCDDKRSGINKIPLYVNQDKMEVLTEEEFNKKDKIKQKDFTMHEGFEGCAKCPIFSICLTDAKKQTSTSPMLKKLDVDLIQKVKTEGSDWALAQLMNLKPSVEGIIYREFEEKIHVKDWNQMWHILTGKEFPSQCTHDIFVSKCHEMQLPCYAGIDWGYSSPSTVVFFFMDRRDNVFVVKTDGMTQVSDPTWIHHIKTKYHLKYRVQLYAADQASQGAIQEMRKAGLPAHNDPKKPEIMTGIQVIKKLLKVPGTSDAKLFLAKETTQHLINEFGLYHYKSDAAGIVTDDPDTENDHWLDALRYPLSVLLGKANIILGGGGLDIDNLSSVQDNNGSYSRVPTATEFAATQGIKFNENEQDSSKLGKIGTKTELDDDGGDDGSGNNSGFLWSF